MNDRERDKKSLSISEYKMKKEKKSSIVAQAKA